jgi:hypothetical protein
VPRSARRSRFESCGQLRCERWVTDAKGAQAGSGDRRETDERVEVQVVDAVARAKLGEVENCDVKVHQAGSLARAATSKVLL